MSRITCLIMVSGFSALSMRSLRLARISVETRSKSAMVCSFLYCPLLRRAFGFVVRLGRLIANQSHFREQVAQGHTRERFEKCGNLRRHLRYVSCNLVEAG